ncbi:hypothetical protein O181_050051 [Austropuccinia psidii MF-1]|uniref:alpha-1,2-Mannosidase n=1 Tax=Austropuccinia psidii MF-1 TaxID=1389203 RepID=A0A9Q3E138_9BASI|nr:hypothetical protein [Austropuccinia psidii MF-1]
MFRGTVRTDIVPMSQPARAGSASALRPSAPWAMTPLRLGPSVANEGNLSFLSSIPHCKVMTSRTKPTEGLLVASSHAQSSASRHGYRVLDVMERDTEQTGRRWIIDGLHEGADVAFKINSIPHQPRPDAPHALKRAGLALSLFLLWKAWLAWKASGKGLLAQDQPPSLFSLQAPRLHQSQLSKERSAKVVDSFKFAYSQYATHAWGRDQINPLNLTGKDTRNGWGATIVDALSTLYVMNMTDEFDHSVEFACTIDFNTSRIPESVSVFETTIRYLGGILSAYELSESRYPCLLQKAKELGNKLAFAWSNPAPFPSPSLDFTQNSKHGYEICIAEAGSLTIEFDRLSYFTGNDTYRQLANNSSMGIMTSPHVFPGLHGEPVRLDGSEPSSSNIGWGAGIDSFLEYAPKYWQLIGTNASTYLEYWVQSVNSSVQHLLHESKDGRLYLYEHSGFNGSQIERMSHLSCFAPGNWMLGARLLGDDKTFSLGLRLAETCAYSYEAMATGIGPETFFDNNGKLEPIDKRFLLRPEVLESMWYAWRLTGDPIWQERGWAAFQAFEKYCRAPGGYTELENVDSKIPTVVDNTESFLFAELFKYFYLIFTPPEVLSLNDYVLNTEAHPFKIRRQS